MNMTNQDNQKNMKLKKIFNFLIIAAGLVFIFIKSPFVEAQIFEDQLLQNPNLNLYIYIKSILYAVITIFVLINYLYTGKLKTLKYICFYLWIYSLFYLLIKISFGFDVTDQGYSLSKAWSLINGGVNFNTDYIWLTSLINGAWLKLFGSPQLIWARLGYAFVVSGIIYFSTKIVFLYAEKNINNFFLALFLSIFFIHYNYYLTINYDNLPVLFILISIFFILSIVNNQKFDSRTAFIISFFSGVFITAAVLSKFSVLPSLLIPVFILTKYRSLFNRRLISLFIAGAVLPLIFFGLYLYTDDIKINHIQTNEITEKDTHLFNTFLNDSMKNETIRQGNAYYLTYESHDIKTLFKQYSSDMIKIIEYMVVFLLLYFIILILEDLQSSNLYKKLYYLVVPLISAGLFFSKYNYHSSFIEFPALITSVALVYLMILLLSGSLSENKKDIIFIAISIYIISFLGSNISLNTAFRSGGATLLVMTSLLFLDSDKYFFKNFKIKYNSTILITLAILGIINVPWLITHRDSSIKYQNYMFRSKELFGIFSTKERTECVDGLIEALKKQKIRDNGAVFVGQIPLFHYIADIKMFLDSPWTETNDFIKTIKLMNSLEYEDRPDIIVISKMSGKSNNWPVRNITDIELKVTLKWKDYFDFFVARNNYKLEYENSMFKVFIK